MEGWNRDRARCMLIMRSMCNEDSNAMIADQHHPKEALDLLQKNYASSLNSNILRLKDEFHAFTLDPSKTVMENISHLKGISRQFRECKEPPNAPQNSQRVA